MTRRFFVSTTAATLAAARPSISQTPREPLVYRDYSRILPDYLRSLAARAYNLRNREIARLTTPEAIRSRQRGVTETFWKLAGGKPERTPLNARVTGSFDRQGYRVEKIVYETQPGFHVSANLYIPTTANAPFPGVLFQMGHSSNGKAWDSYQRCCQGLVRLGFLVLAFDPMGQGERTYYPGPNPSRSRLPGGADDEHTVPGKQMLLIGDSSVRLQTWDAMRSLDYLASYPMVDPKRLASTGTSGGGTNTMLLAAVDDRLAAAAVACGNTENIACRNFNPPGATDDAEQNFAGSGPLGFDRWDLLYPMAPKPLLFVPSANDFAGTYSPNYIASGLEEFAKLQRIYTALGHADRIAWEDSPLPHNLAYGSRIAIYNWFLRWLKQEKPVSEEPEVAPEKDEVLFAAKGSTVLTLGSETPLTMLRKRPIEKVSANLPHLLALDDAEAAPPIRLAKTKFRHADIEAIEIRSALNVFLPAWLYQPRTGRAKALLLLIDPAGRAQWQEGGLYETLAANGYSVCALDVRGIGHLTPEYSRGAARHTASHHSEQHYSWSSMILGKPLVGQRVTDILAAAGALRAGSDAPDRIVLAARGILTAPALFAAALDSNIHAVYLSGGLVSYRNVLEMEEYRGGNYHNPAVANQQDLFGAFVPGLLKQTDLPELAASLAPRRLTLAGTIDAAGKTLDIETVRKVYAAAANVQVTANAAWDASALSAAAGS
ncbi:MAG: acetylxylan esterase [Bryobacteraceae bacterium]|nr:acetylxylan esterase [Bryobacteraceae bacterium]